MIHDIYSSMPPEIGVAQRRHNKEEIARLEIEGDARRNRIRQVMAAAQIEQQNARNN